MAIEAMQRQERLREAERRREEEQRREQERRREEEQERQREEELRREQERRRDDERRQEEERRKDDERRRAEERKREEQKCRDEERRRTELSREREPQASSPLQPAAAPQEGVHPSGAPPAQPPAATAVSGTFFVVVTAQRGPDDARRLNLCSPPAYAVRVPAFGRVWYAAAQAEANSMQAAFQVRTLHVALPSSSSSTHGCSGDSGLTAA